jgi:hypothetical protein
VHRNFPLKSDQIPKASYALLAFKPDIMSTSWVWMAYPAFPASMHFMFFFYKLVKMNWD